MDRGFLLASDMASASWHEGVMFETDPMKGQPAVAGCCMTKRRCSHERPGDAGGDDILMLSDRRMVGEFSSARCHGSR
ncbi:hypothetical protein B8B80_20180 [Pseudomonas aeruginosa]|nr:hypothetical protein BG483_08950 [Pseudomonas aeruginosa]EQL40253.1 hypothetical protein M770_18215 [Pseudomonas aeruginosa VRFPA03]KJC24339.1 hypothetical protein TN45_09765 [Pseudomonas aeruginosa]KRV19575.1 hypothetical protein AN459_25595 [Pseudomonas aeruginosa]KSI76664.1 hypothetical protein AO992_17010 [Pseudomonas aeruginosa]